jgi:hypothetical protein
MAAQVIMNCKLWLGAYDLSGHINSIAFALRLPTVDATTLEDTWTKALPTTKGVSIQMEGFWSAGTGEPDDVMFAALGVTDTPVTFAVSPSVGATAYTFLASVGTYTPGGSFGEMLKFSVAAEG